MLVETDTIKIGKKKIPTGSFVKLKFNALVNQTFDRSGLGLDCLEGRVVESRLASIKILYFPLHILLSSSSQILQVLDAETDVYLWGATLRRLLQKDLGNLNVGFYIFSPNTRSIPTTPATPCKRRITHSAHQF
jgi:hypothetical protein